MFEYRIDKDGTISKLNTEQESRVISHISQSFTEWDSLRNDQKDRYRDLKPELYLEKEAKKDTKSKFLGHIFDAVSYQAEYYFPILQE